MQHRSSRSLVQYWDEIRAGRQAPQRCEIDPARIAALLPVTFILDCSTYSGYRFRLAGTRICEQLGRELRHVDLLDLFEAQDRKALEILLRSVVAGGGIGVIELEATSAEGRNARFEMVVMPVIHASRSVNRLLGCLTAIEAPYWLGSVATVRHRIANLRVVPIDGMPQPPQEHPQATPFANETPSTIAGDGRRRFRVFEGGRSQ
jgi:hypothetical protein